MCCKGLVRALIVLAAFNAVNFSSLHAQSEFLDISSNVVGTVTDVKGNSMSLLRDIDHGFMRITTDTNSVYNNAQGLSELKKGDKIQVRYHQAKGLNVAISVTKMGRG